MARFLFTVWPFAGHYFPTIPIAQALRSLGHEVAFYSGARAVPVIEREGFQMFPFNEVDEERVDRLMYTQQEHASRRDMRALRRLLREWLLSTLPAQVSDIENILAEWPPDVIMTETSMLGPVLVLSETQYVPVAVFSTFFACMLPGPDAPPFGMGLPRPHTLPTRLLSRSVQVLVDLFGGDFRKEADRLRALYGLEPLSVTVTERSGQMPLYLVPGVPELDYERRDLPQTLYYVGPCLWNSSPAKASRLDTASWTRRERPLIHVSEGTMHTDEPLILRAVAEALADLPLDVLMTTGGRDKSQINLGELAPNIYVEQWVSHRDLFPYTDLLITTGGAGTVMAALAAGVPMLVVPVDWDKPENAQRVVEAGAGLRIPFKRITPQRVRENVNLLLNEPRYKERANYFAVLFNELNGPQRAAELLIELASENSQQIVKGVD